MNIINNLLYTTLRYGISDAGRPLSEECQWLIVPEGATEEDLSVNHAFHSPVLSALVLDQNPQAAPLITGWWMWVKGTSEITDDPTNGILRSHHDDVGVLFTEVEDIYWAGPIGRSLLPGVRLISRTEWLMAVEAWTTQEAATVERIQREAREAIEAQKDAEQKEREASILKALNGAKTNGERAKIIAAALSTSS